MSPATVTLILALHENDSSPSPSLHYANTSNQLGQLIDEVKQPGSFEFSSSLLISPLQTEFRSTLAEEDQTGSLAFSSISGLGGTGAIGGGYSGYLSSRSTKPPISSDKLVGFGLVEGEDSVILPEAIGKGSDSLP